MKKLGLASVVTLTLMTTGVLLPVQNVQSAGGLADLFNRSESSNNKILPVNQAFSIMPEQKDNTLTVYFDVKDGYYLYQEKIKLELPEGVTASPLQFNQTPQFVDDPDFGRVPVFDKSFTATTTLTTSTTNKNPSATVKWQGCAKAGLCYPPEKTDFTLTKLTVTAEDKSKHDNQNKNSEIVEKKTEAQATVEKNITPTENQLVTNTENITITDKQNSDKQNLKTTESVDLSATESINIDSPVNPTSTEAIADEQTINALINSADNIEDNVNIEAETTENTNTTIAETSTLSNSHANTTENTASTPSLIMPEDTEQDPFGLLKHPWLALLLLFLAGLGLAFTPCVLPMLPIIANIIARQHNPSAQKGLLLTGGYGLGVATSYGLLGALIAIFGQSIGIIHWLQNPIVLLSFAGLFILLGLYMLDLLPIRLPAKLAMKLQGLTQVGENRLGSVTGSFITGFFSALVVSPCVSAPLAGALAGVSTLGNPVIGFFALFMLGLGLSTPLIFLGATQGNFMPKAGEWMNWVKSGFALLLFAVALLMVERVFVTSWMLGLWAIWFAVVAMWAWQWQGRGKPFTQAISMILTFWTLCLVIGMALGSRDNWQPLKPLTQMNITSSQTDIKSMNYPKIHKIEELTPILAKNSKVLVDVTADWCIECRIMDKTLFANPPSNLQNWQVIKLDVTDNTPDSKAVYQQLQVFGPPVLLYFQDGKLVHRQNGEVKREQFETVLAKF